MNLKEFIDPPKQHRPIPFWSWNSEVSPSEIETQIRDMKKKGFGGCIIHAAPGLKTPYLEDDWMQAIRKAQEAGDEYKVEVWLHDDDRLPSGSAGGKTTANNDEYLAQALIWEKDGSNLGAEILESAIAYTKTGPDGVSEMLEEAPEDLAGIGVFYVHRSARGQAQYNGEGYADLLNPEVVKAFIENTYEKYEGRFSYDFGEFMPGILTDSPQVNPAEALRDEDRRGALSFPWSTGFAGYFEKLHGYNPTGHLHHLVSVSEEGFKFRHDFWTAVNERFLEAYTIQLSSWFSSHEKIFFAGRYLSENNFGGMITSGGSVMAHYEYLDVPTVNAPGRGGGTPVSLRQAASVAHQLGKERIIGRVFGSTGYDITFAEMKALADVHFALGVTSLSPQHVIYSMLGDAPSDNPPSFSYHQPYWEKIKVINDYLARCSWAVSRGRDTAKVLIMSPVSAAYGAHDSSSADGGEFLSHIEGSYTAVVNELSVEHIAFDIGDERIVSRHGSASGDTLRVGQAEYSCVILPCAPSWKASTLDLLETFNGPIIVMGDLPSKVDGTESDRVSSLTERTSVIAIPDDPSRATATIVEKFGRDVSVALEDGQEARTVLVNHRIEATAHIIFIANTDRTAAKNITITARALGGVVELDPLTGRAYRYHSEISDGNTVIRTSLAPSGSRIFLIDQTQTSVEGKAQSHEEQSVISIEGPYAYRALQDNSLTIDRCTLEVDGTLIMKNAPIWQVKEALWERTGLAEYRGHQPWVLKQRNVRSRTNKTVLTFEFTVQEIPEAISLAMEDSDKFTVAINGSEIDFTPAKWHIERRFRMLDLKEHLVKGTNTITATTDFLWDTAVHNVSIVGDFAVGAESDGFPILAASKTLDSGDWCKQGYPFYHGALVYSLEFTLEKDSAFRYELDLSGAAGTVCYVTVNGEEVGAIPFPPFRGDITDALKNGNNVLDIEVVGSLRNTFGPFHVDDTDGTELIGPESFRGEENRTDSYRFVPYGFIRPPKLIKLS